MIIPEVTNIDLSKKDQEPQSSFVKKGTYGSVLHRTLDNKEIAIKYFHNKEDFLKNVAEVNHLGKCKHGNIVKLIGAGPNVYEGKLHYYIMEFAPNGSLDELLYSQNNIDYSLEQSLSWIYQCCRAIEYLHEEFNPPFLHRDVKPSNLLLFNYGRKVKLCDFGTVKVVQNTQNTVESGTFLYMAPEVMLTVKGNQAHYDTKCDVYSIGIVLWELLTRRRPFEQYTNSFGILMHVAMEKQSLPDIPDCPKVLDILMKSCWRYEYKARPKVSTVTKILRIFLKRMLEPSSMNNDNSTNSSSSSSYELIHNDITDSNYTTATSLSSSSNSDCYQDSWPESLFPPLDCKVHSILPPSDIQNNNNDNSTNHLNNQISSNHSSCIVVNSYETGGAIGGYNITNNNDLTDNCDVPYEYIDQTLLPKEPIQGNEESKQIFEHHTALLKRYLFLFKQCQELGMANNSLLNELSKDSETRRTIQKYCELKYKESQQTQEDINFPN